MLYERLKETLSHFLIYGIGQISASAIGFLLIPLYTRCLEPGEYGTLALFALAFQLLVIFLGMGFYVALFRSYYDYDGKEQRKLVISTALITIFIGSVIGLSVVLVMASPLCRLLLGDLRYLGLFRLVFITAFLDTIRAVPMAVMRAQKRSRVFTIVSVSFFAVKLGLIILLVAFFRMGIAGVVLGGFAASLTGVWCFVLIRDSLAPIFSLAEARKMLRFGLPLVPYDVCGIILTLSDRYFLKVFSTLAVVGVYSLGYQIARVIQILIEAPFGLIWSAMMFSVEKEPGADRFYTSALTYYAFVAMWVGLGVSCLAEDFLKIVANPSYWGAWRVVPLVCLSYVIFGSDRVTSIGLVLKRRTEYQALGMAVAAGLNLLLNYIFIPRYGMMGAVWATLISYCALVVLKFFWARRFYPVRVEWVRLGKIFFAALLIYGLSRWIRVEAPGTSLLIRGGLSLTFPCILALAGFYSRGEREAIALRIRRIGVFWGKT